MRIGLGEKAVLLLAVVVAILKLFSFGWALLFISTMIGSWIGYMKWKGSVWHRLGVPGPPPTIAIGNMLEIPKKGLHNCHMEWSRKYGKVFGTYMMTTPDLNVTDVDLLKMVLIKDFNNFTNRRQMMGSDDHSEQAERRRNGTVFGHVLNMINDERWKTIRNTITPAFTAGKIKQMLPLLNEATDALHDTLSGYSRAGEAFDAKDCFGNFTMDVIASVALATKVDTQRHPDNPVITHAKKVMQISFGSLRVMFALFFPWTMNKLNDWFDVKLFGESDAFFMQTLTKLIEERRNDHSKNRVDFLQLLLDEEENLEGDNVKKLTTPEIISQCFLFLVAGYDTTATTLQFIAYMLAIHPDVQEKCYQEISSALDDANNQVNYDLLQNNLPYLESVILETLRIYPPAVGFDRHCSQAYDLNGIMLPKNSTVTVPTYVIHHSAEHYPDPEEFKPDRFSPAEKAQRNPLTYLPFGYGPRNCIGMRFAMFQIKHVLLHVLRNFQIVPSDKTEIPLEVSSTAGLLKPKKPVYLKVTPRGIRCM